MRKKLLLSVFILSVLGTQAQNTDYTRLVNPFIGTGGHGHTFPGATLPFGMVQLSPDTRADGSWDGCSGYHYNDSFILGFSHTHLSGTGCSDYGDIMIQPIMGSPVFEPKKYASRFSHSTEQASAGYYKVKLDDENILVELTTSTRVGFHKYTFNQGGTASIILDLQHRDKLIGDSIILINDHCIEGYRASEAWAKDQRVYFRIEFSKSFKDKQIFTAGDNQGKAGFTFDVKSGEVIQVKVSLSAVDRIGARNNMQSEISHWDFNKTKTEAQNIWNTELGKISVKGGTDEQRTIFYTALYHTFLQPNIFNDADGRYRGRDFKIHKTDGNDYYTVFSLWDTYRAAHPLYNLVQPKRNLDFINTFLEQYKQSGNLPIWELWSNETDCMIGYHTASVMADAIAKGNDKFDISLAQEAMLKNEKNKEFGIPRFRQQGYLTADDESESVSKTLEYAYDDWCISKILLHDTLSASYPLRRTDAQKLTKNRMGWQSLFNTQTGFVQPRQNGGWYKPFVPAEVNNNYTEANGWQYGFYVPHDMENFISNMGGPLAFEKKLDELFTADSKTSGRDQADITGLIGQYAHGNEPSHHIAYLYNYIGKPEKTAQRVQQIVNDLYKNAPDGLAGNEDCGQMSAWYVFSAMGFYPVCPGKNEYIRGMKPLFDEIRINGKLLDSLNLNITNYNYTKTGLPSYSAPVFETAGKTFRNSTKITLNGNGNKTPIYYMFLDTSEVRKFLYTKPFTISQSCRIRAFNTLKANNTEAEMSSEAYFHKMPNEWGIKIASKYNKQYTADGDEGIIDGLRGDRDWRKGGWQGYQGQDFEAVVDLKKETNILQAGAGFLQDTRSWILMPKEIIVEYSLDGISYLPLGTVVNRIADNSMDVQKRDLLTAPKRVKARYVRIKAINYGKLPSWHPGKDGDAFIFVDEIIIH
jgi:predicted alpha-1,2-mannosidase